MGNMKRFVLPLLLLVCASSRAATLTVTSLADDGSSGTLRAVVASAQDGGSTWTALRGNAADATILITQDQRGVEYPFSAATGLPKTCIGAAAVKRPVGTLLRIK